MKMKSVFARTYFWLIILIFLSFIITLIVVDNVFEKSDISNFKRHALIEGKYVESQLVLKPVQDWQDWVDQYQAIQALDVNLVRIDSWPTEQKEKFLREELGVGWTLHYRVSGSNQAVALIEADGIGVNRDEILELVLPFFAVFIVLGLGVSLLARKISQPVTDLSEAATKIGFGDFGVRVNEDIPYPISNMARSLNLMVDRLNALSSEQQILIGAIPHELRTPLGRVRFAVDMTHNMKSIDQLQQQLYKIDGYVDELEQITEDTLMLAKIQHDSSTPLGQFAMRKLLNELISSVETDDAINLTLHCQIEGLVEGDAALIKRAISNLINNALHYAKSRVIVKAVLNGHKVEVSVGDDGEGISQDKQNEVFMAFSRIDQSRTRSTGGSGLGLAIVALIMKKHRGTVAVSRSKLGGALFKLVW